MALPGYPQTHNSPDPEVVTTESDTVQYEGPFSTIKILSDANTEHAVLYIYLDKAGFDSNTTEGTDYFIVKALATDTLSGPIYGFIFHTDSNPGSSVIGYRYSTDI